MPELSPEERKKIYEEEKKKKEAGQKKNAGIGCLVVILVVFFIWISGVFKSEKKEKSSQSSSFISLKASARFDGAQFIIVNDDAFDWTNVKFEINSGILKGGYIYRALLMKTKMTYTVGAMQFAKSSGERFNPFTMKPISIDIFCDTPRGMGSYHGSWE